MPGPILIGIHGARGAGKDTTAGFIKELAAASEPALSVVRRGFADYPKWAFARQFFPDISLAEAVAWCDKHKDTDMHVVVEPKRRPYMHQAEVQFRDCMNQFATESARELYGDNFWVDRLLPLDPPGLYPIGSPHLSWRNNFRVRGKVADICPITDLRADNEMERIRVLRGFCVKVRRKDAEDAQRRYYEERGIEPHLFARELPDEVFDYIINNDDNDMGAALARTDVVLSHIALHIENDTRPSMTIEVKDV